MQVHSSFAPHWPRLLLSLLLCLCFLSLIAFDRPSILSMNANSTVAQLYDNRHLMLRQVRTSLVLRFRSLLTQELRLFFFEKGFTEVHPPCLVQTQCEGGSTLFKLTYYGEPVRRARRHTDKQTEWEREQGHARSTFLCPPAFPTSLCRSSFCFLVVILVLISVFIGCLPSFPSSSMLFLAPSWKHHLCWLCLCLAASQAYLTQSSQLYLETCITSMSSVFCIAPSFRAEKSRKLSFLYFLFFFFFLSFPFLSLSCLVLSCLVLSCLVLSCLVVFLFVSFLSPTQLHL